ncbi:hypothetical protein [Pannonibacter phragmitetus]|nr:hypothetical protein [Pannonibacter phragmitetus]
MSVTSTGGVPEGRGQFMSGSAGLSAPSGQRHLLRQQCFGVQA